MKLLFNLCILATAFLLSCNKDNLNVCMVNKSAHRVHFWRIDGDHWRNFYEDGCNVPVESGSSFSWRVQFPGEDLFGDGNTCVFAEWEGKTNIDQDNVDIEFTDQSGTVVFDFRDPVVGNYLFTKTELEITSANDTVNVSTIHDLQGALSKDVLFNQLKVDIGNTLNKTAIFTHFTHKFQFEGSAQAGSTNEKDQIDFEIAVPLSNGNTLRQVYSGKKV